MRKPLLNLGRLDYFKYDLNEIIDHSDIEESLAPSFKASIMAKARNMSIDDAKDYIKEQESLENVSKETSIKIYRLLDRYTKVR